MYKLYLLFLTKPIGYRSENLRIETTEAENESDLRPTLVCLLCNCNISGTTIYWPTSARLKWMLRQSVLHFTRLFFLVSSVSYYVTGQEKIDQRYWRN